MYFLVALVFLMGHLLICVEASHALPVASLKADPLVTLGVESFTADALQHNRLSCVVHVMSKDAHLLRCAEILKKDLEFSGQLEVALELQNPERVDPSGAIEITVKKYKELEKKAVCLYLSLVTPGCSVPLLRKKYTIQKQHLLKGYHAMSGDLLKALTQQTGPVLYTLSYCKRIDNKTKVICVSDYVGDEEKIVAGGEGICTAPAWHTNRPVLLYSRFTAKNGELQGVNLRKNKQLTLVAHDGLAMQPSFSPNGKQAVLCSSQTGSSELYLYTIDASAPDQKKLTQLTFNKANNSSPCWLPTGDIVFCSDFERNTPQIYYLNRSSGAVARLTSGKGYCAAPSYCSQSNKIVYVRYVEGCFQLFTLYIGSAIASRGEVVSALERQLTFNKGDKHEPVWSPCGNYILCSRDFHEETGYKKCRQIAALNLYNNEMLMITQGTDDKSFPSWSAQTLYQS